jgi:glycolate oxidase FAD binding subunit
VDLTATWLTAFAEEVGSPSAGPVTCAGGRTQWAVGGPLDEGARPVTAPAGVVAHQPGEMIVRVRAGTRLAELSSAVAVGGQYVPLESDQPEQATVGGILACGRSGIRRLGQGAVRDCVLEVTAVGASGQVVRAGAPLVKNVTGFDLCRLLVGSVGTLAFLAEVVLRCHPAPEAELWWRSEEEADPFAVHAALVRPLSVLWDGRSVWVGLSGWRADLEAQEAAVLAPAGFRPVDGPPPRPGPIRHSRPPAALRDLPASARGGSWLAEIGVGIVHADTDTDFAGALTPPAPAAGIVELHRRLKERFDPAGRLNPGRSPLGAR